MPTSLLTNMMRTNKATALMQILVHKTLSAWNPIFRKTYENSKFSISTRLMTIWYTMILPVACIVIHNGAAMASISAGTSMSCVSTLA